MTKEDIINAALDAGMSVKFAAILAAVAVLAVEDEREACAALCEARFTGDLTREDMEAKRCAEAIRARGGA